jgi:hypothetical protein
MGTGAFFDFLANRSELFQAAFVVGCLGVALAHPVSAKVFASQNQALGEAFPEATRIERDTRILLSGEVERFQAITGEKEPAKLVVLHTAWRDDEILGFAHIDVHNVRTKPEAFMVVLTPEGTVRSVRILAFHEPLDYLPTDRWYGQFQGKRKGDTLRIGGDLHGVVGATLSARAAADGVRRMLAYYEILLKDEVQASAVESIASPAEAVAPSANAVASAPGVSGPDGSASEH